MSFRGEQFNKSNGITYIYEATSVWNASKQRSEQKRIYIGKKDPVTGNLIPNKKYFELHGKGSSADEAPQDVAKPAEVLSSHCYGNIALMQHAADGSVHDVSTLTGLISFIEKIKLNQMHFVMDKGFYSIKGINPLLKNHTKFAIGVPFTTDVAKKLVNKYKDGICCSANAIMVGENIYYAQTHRTMLEDRRVYYHVYYDEQRHTDEAMEGVYLLVL